MEVDHWNRPHEQEPQFGYWLDVYEFMDKYGPAETSNYPTRGQFLKDLGALIDNYYGEVPDVCWP